MKPVQIQLVEFVTHDVKRFVLTKPDGFHFEPGQAVGLATEKDSEDHAFTPTSQPNDGVIEFTIKQYPNPKGMTKALHQMKAGDSLFMSDPFGEIGYKGPGTFIAAGTGITPFLAIIRTLAESGDASGQTLIYTNKTPKDIICEKELRDAFGDRCFLTCTRQSGPGYDDVRIDADYLAKRIEDKTQFFYICGPQAFVKETAENLERLGASPDRIIYEK